MLPGSSRAGCLPHRQGEPIPLKPPFAAVRARSLSEDATAPWVQSKCPSQPHQGGQQLSWAQMGPHPSISFPPFPQQGWYPSSSPWSTGTRDAPAWHVFPALPRQRQKHNKQQQHTADSRQTFPLISSPVRFVLFPLLPRGSCCHGKGTTAPFGSILRHPGRSCLAKPLENCEP